MICNAWHPQDSAPALWTPVKGARIQPSLWIVKPTLPHASSLPLHNPLGHLLVFSAPLWPTLLSSLGLPHFHRGSAQPFLLPVSSIELSNSKDVLFNPKLPFWVTVHFTNKLFYGLLWGRAVHFLSKPCRPSRRSQVLQFSQWTVSGVNCEKVLASGGQRKALGEDSLISSYPPGRNIPLTRSHRCVFRVPPADSQLTDPKAPIPYLQKSML